MLRTRAGGLVRIDLKPLLLIIRELGFVEDGFDGVLRDAGAAIDALIGWAPTEALSRQLEAVLDEFRVDWEGWRSLTNDARIRWVLVLLSNPGLSIADVARAAG